MLSPSLSTWCYYLTGGKYLAGAATNGAGNCVNLLMAQCGKPVRELDNMLAGRDFSGAPVFLPFIFGERCPGWSESPYGGFSAGSQELADHYYAVLEGVLFNLYQCYEDLAAAGGVPNEIRVSGGIVNSPVWLQMCADIFGRQIQAAEMQHASLLGGVVLAAQANGEDISKDVWNSHKTVRPDGVRSVFYKARYQKYLDYYRQKGL
jgi:gluconokinase